MKRKFLEWWNQNGKPAKQPSWEAIKGEKWAKGITRDKMREWIIQQGGGVRKKRVEPIGNIDYKKKLEKGMLLKDVPSEVLQHLSETGYNINISDGYCFIDKTVIPKQNIYNKNWDGNKVFRFGVVSDTHLCNKFQQLTFLNYLYDVFEEKGINTVYHAGDLVDGDIRRNKYEIFKYGADDQADYVINNYPKKNGIITEFITGNHDHWHVQNGGVDIGKIIAKARPDMKYLGCSNVIINLTPNCKMELNHPLDGAAYALSYSIQKYMDSMSGGEKPNILINGHHHKAMYLFYRNIHAIEAGTLEAQTPFMKGKRIAANVGGWIIEAHVDHEGTITAFMPTFIPQYYSIKEDY